MWEAAVVAQIDPPTDAIVGDWLTLPDAADQLGLPGRIIGFSREGLTR